MAGGRGRNLCSRCALWQLLCLAAVVLSCQATDEWQPEQIHISYGEEPSQMVVTWSTSEPVGSEVYYGRRRPDTRAVGAASRFVDGGELRRAQYVHRATLTGLQPNTTYVYQVGSDAGWSELFFFTSMAAGVDWSPRLAVYGDMGSENAQSLPRLQRDVQQGLYDAVLHVGDFAYDMDSDNAQVGDEFMRQLQPIAGYLPYMTCPGNHEQRYNFSNYKNRFTMPRDGDNMFYSFDMGPVHFVSVSSEYYYYLNYGLKMAGNQYRWLQRDLAEANRPESRALRPWLVVFGHRPMYCSDNDTDDCTKQFDAMRVGIPVLHLYGMEELLMEYGVDLAIWAHEHSYERLWPVYNETVYNGTAADPYRNPGAPVHIVTGSAGCKERVDPFNATVPAWSAFRSSDYGYTRLTFHNGSHVHLQQVSDDKDGAIIDDFWIRKDTHKAYGDLRQTRAGYL
ncbi:acid phosphatase type 7-like [Amphibalanus amphitrite]|uniref:acid phosphatase type 7-like n=1 Tax=Amphibalanus amphitrite TaxID=1232801 RepID=UPI001C918078|nr:acid phosphatase type 7-like [Amphibalanus amphitrite]